MDKDKIELFWYTTGFIMAIAVIMLLASKGII